MMRRIMRVGAAMLALLVAANVAVAQGGGGGGGGMGGQRGGGRGGAGQVQRLMTDITLTAEQQAKVDEVVKWYDAELAKLPPMQMGGGAPPDSAAMAARQKLQAELREKVKAALTPEQAKQFDANVEAMGRGRGGRRGGGL